MMPDRHSALRAFAGWNTRLPESQNCSSGGAAYLLGKFFIESLGGVVYGTAYTTGKEACVTRVTTLQELEATKGSRYVRGLFPKKVQDALIADLQGGKPVLFVGTPCQVAGVRGKVERFRIKSGMTGKDKSGMTGKDKSGMTVGRSGITTRQDGKTTWQDGMTGGDKVGELFCVDLLCHGAPPQGYLRAEVRHLIGDKPFTDIRFRGDGPHDYHLSIWDGEQCLYHTEARKQPYLLAMLRGVTLMEGCYKCPFATPERCGDITLGDYIGLGARDGFRAPAGQKVSYISLNTEKGESLYEAFLQANQSFQSIERSVDERLSYRPSILEPAGRHPLRNAFLQRLPRLGFARAIRRTMRGEILRESPLYRTLHHWAHTLLRHQRPTYHEVPGKNPPKGAEP